MTVPKPKGIVFTNPSVLAIMARRKTQTRRVMKPQPKLIHDRTWTWPDDGAGSKVSWAHGLRSNAARSLIPVEHCPDKPGDIRYVKEGLRRSPTGFVRYAADDGVVVTDGEFFTWRWKRPCLSSRYMPAWAACTWIKITDARAQRVQEISADDLLAEGVGDWSRRVKGVWYDVNWRFDFAELWNSLHAKRGHGWDTNPWVWALTFEVTTP